MFLRSSCCIILIVIDYNNHKQKSKHILESLQIMKKKREYWEAKNVVRFVDFK